MHTLKFAPMGADTGIMDHMSTSTLTHSPSYGVTYSGMHGPLPTLADVAYRAASLAANTAERLADLMADDVAHGRTVPVVAASARTGQCGDCGVSVAHPCADRCAACYAALVGASMTARALRAK